MATLTVAYRQTMRLLFTSSSGQVAVLSRGCFFVNAAVLTVVGKCSFKVLCSQPLKLFVPTRRNYISHKRARCPNRLGVGGTRVERI